MPDRRSEPRRMAAADKHQSRDIYPGAALAIAVIMFLGFARNYISMGAAGWHICLDVLDHALSGLRSGRIVGPAAMNFEGWQRLNADYARQFSGGN